VLRIYCVILVFLKITKRILESAAQPAGPSSTSGLTANAILLRVGSV